MSAVSKKLNSKAGAAMVVALVFFLLCIMVGVVILTAASVSAGSVALERQTWRETEALTSAAQLLADDVKGMKFTGAYTKTETVTTTVTEDGTDSNGNTKYKTTVAEDTSKTFNSTDTKLAESELLNETFLNKLYQQKLDSVTDDPEKITVNLTFTASATDGSGGSMELNIPEVKCTLTVKTDYTITAVLKCGDSTLTVVFAPTVSESAGTVTPSTSKEESTGTVSKAEKTTKTTYTTTITWGKPVMTKGGTTS